jgi:two-component system, chemotaxis family, protein-glutamate methylesterase/glutaminase
MAKGSINNRYELVVIGGSAGSLEVLMQLLPELRKDLSLAIIIVLHRKNGESMLAELLSDKTTWPVKEAEEKDPIEKGNIYLAPADYHLMIENDKTLSLDYSEKIHFCRPAIDVTFETAAETYGSSTVGVLLSGANADGAEGMQLIKNAGGLTIVQDPGEASVSYMPMQAIDTVKVDYVVRTKEMAEIINRLNLS